MVGYARVSTEEQRTLRQVDELRAAGCAEVVEERASGADRTRPALAALLRRGLARSIREPTSPIADLHAQRSTMDHISLSAETPSARSPDCPD